MSEDGGSSTAGRGLYRESVMKLDPRDGATAKGAFVRYVIQLVKAARAAGPLERCWSDGLRVNGRQDFCRLELPFYE